MNDFNKEVCNLQHKGIDEKLEGIETKIDLLFTRLNWFYVLVITCIGGIITTVITSCGG